MTVPEFDKGMARLERIFNQGAELQGEVRMEYLEALRFLESAMFEAAVGVVIETFKPFPSESFPSPSTIQEAVRIVQAERDIPGRDDPDTRALDFCQLCHNTGMYFAPNNMARACRCEKGRLRRASWVVPVGARKREAKIQDILDKLPESKGPVRGLEEKNAMGFWEPTREEHEKWIAEKREQIKKLEARDAERKEAAGLRPRTLDREALRRVVAETKVAVEERSLKPEKDEIQLCGKVEERSVEPEEDEIPF